jgi:hypothetical protein
MMMITQNLKSRKAGSMSLRLHKKANRNPKELIAHGNGTAHRNVSLDAGGISRCSMPNIKNRLLLCSVGITLSLLAGA